MIEQNISGKKEILEKRFNSARLFSDFAKSGREAVFELGSVGGLSLIHGKHKLRWGEYSMKDEAEKAANINNITDSVSFANILSKALLGIKNENLSRNTSQAAFFGASRADKLSSKKRSIGISKDITYEAIAFNEEESENLDYFSSSMTYDLSKALKSQNSEIAAKAAAIFLKSSGVLGTIRAIEGSGKRGIKLNIDKELINEISSPGDAAVKFLKALGIKNISTSETASQSLGFWDSKLSQIKLSYSKNDSLRKDSAFSMKPIVFRKKGLSVTAKEHNIQTMGIVTEIEGSYPEELLAFLPKELAQKEEAAKAEQTEKNIKLMPLEFFYKREASKKGRAAYGAKPGIPDFLGNEAEGTYPDIEFFTKTIPADNSPKFSLIEDGKILERPVEKRSKLSDILPKEDMEELINLLAERITDRFLGDINEISDKVYAIIEDRLRMEKMLRGIF